MPTLRSVFHQTICIQYYLQPIFMTILLVLFLTLIAPFQSQAVARKQKVTVPAVKLEFQEFLDPSITELKLSEKLLSLQGQRVRLVGYMAQMEEPPSGAFYLCARPVRCDESGGGIGDLPVTAVLVIAPEMRDKKIPFTARPLAVTGRLEIGNGSDGAASIRLILAPSVPFTTHPPRNLKPKLTHLIYKRRNNL